MMLWREFSFKEPPLRRLCAVLLSCAWAGVCSAAPAAPFTASLSAAMPDDAQLAEQRYRNSIALHAKLLCSGVFVSGRLPENIIREDLQWSEYYFHDWAYTRWTVDHDNKRVSLWAPASGPHAQTPTYTAIYNPALGCTLLPDGAERVAFEPVDVASALPPAADLDWPNGERNADGHSADLTKIRKMLEYAFDDSRQEKPQHTRALLVVHKGKIIAEQYAPGFSSDMPLTGWSMGKTIAAGLFGILVKETGIDIDAPAPVQEWRTHGDPRGTITPRHLLHMASGLKFHNPSVTSSYYYSDMHDHESVYFRGQNTEQLVLNQPLSHAPGTVFQYRNTNTLTLMSIIKHANTKMGAHHLTWPRKALFDKIGARSFTLEPDAYGNFIITGNDYATARDWARLGLLFLQDGKWNKQKLWPTGWRNLISEPSPARNDYGGQVWLNVDGKYPSAPADAVFFVGWLSQIVMIIPSHDLVIVRLGFSDSGGFDPYFDKIIDDTLKALN